MDKKTLTNRISKFFFNLLFSGVQDDYEYALSRRVRMVNFISVTFFIIWLFFSILLKKFDINFASLICFISALTNLLAFYKNRKGKHDKAIKLLSIMNLICFIQIGIHYGRISGIHYFLIAWIVSISFLFDSPKKLAPYFIINVLSLIGLELFFQFHKPIICMDFKGNIQWISIITSLVFIKIMIDFFKKDNLVYQKTLAEKNEILKQQKEEITSQNDLLEEQNTEIEAQNIRLNYLYNELTSSVNYASRIQRAILLPEQIISDRFPESFILFKPKDIVSGDFYWYKNVGKFDIIAAADCTGHGVPGAFITAIVNTLLHEIVDISGTIQPHHILTQLHIRLLQTLNLEYHQEKVADGLDIAICLINSVDKSISYAGAKRPLIFFKNGELIEYKATNMSIGGTQISKKNFDSTTIHYSSGDRFYMYSDGYPDQFGGENNKKLKTKVFKQIIESIQNKKLTEQKDSLESALKYWQGSYNQTDDILVVGIEL